MLSILITLSALSGIMFGFLFRATVLPVVTAGLIGGICVDGWLRRLLGTELLLTIVVGLFALQAGYIVGLWIVQLWQQRK